MFTSSWRNGSRSFRPRLEILETRTLLSVCTVDRLTDNAPTTGGEGDNGRGDLRWCVIESLFRADTINFDVTGTINLAAALPNLTRSVSIDGPGPELMTIRRDTGGNYQVFAIATGVTANIFGLTISNGVGGISNSGTLSISNSIVQANSSSGISSSGTLTITNSTISGNSVGGIFNQGGTLTVSYTTITGNGLGILSGNATTTVTNSTISGNNGGGIDNRGMLSISNSTIAGNSSLYGAGIVIQLNGRLTVSNSTIAGNVAGGSGGGIEIFSGMITVRNTIIAGNMAPNGPDVYGNLGSQGHNLIGNPQDMTGWVDTDLLHVNPRLGPLQDNGGPTQTMGLLPGSPAVDAGDNANAPDFDQRGEGFDRTVGATIDIGAFEAQIGSATSFQVDAPNSVMAGMPFDVTVTALDAYNHVASGYAGTVRITTSDPGEGIFLPPDYTFTANDGGIHTFPNGVILVTPGDQTVTATDTQDDSITGSATVTITDGGSPRMGRRNHSNPIVDQGNVDFRNDEKRNWTGYDFGSQIEGQVARDRGEFLFLDNGLDFLELAIWN
jgi:hypothetical protein